jgi:TldD protein
VATPLTDLRCAAALKLAPTGHGRRVDFRHPALPRMSHTSVAPHQGALAQLLEGVEDGLLVSFLTPRHVHLASGDFSFFIIEARRIVRGTLGAYVGPALLRGNGREALGRIDAVGADLASFQGLKGCGKLDQPNLPVSFGLPAIRFTSLAVEPWDR